MTTAILDFCAARRAVLLRELINDFASDLVSRLEFIANASDAELDEYEATLSPEARAIFGLAVNDAASDTGNHSNRGA